MSVPFLDLQAQYRTIRDEVEAAIRRVVESQRFILGPEVGAFEEEVATYCDAKHAVGVSSGTDALLAALMAADVGPGAEVVTTAYTFFATAGVISRLGATPVFVDIDPDTYNMDPGAAVEALTPRTRAIVPVHLFGRCAHMDPLLEAADREGLLVVEDAAQAIGARDARGRSAGSVGDAGCFSFFPSKNLGGFGDGGMAVTDDADFAESLRILRVHGGQPKYHHSVVGGNFRLDALQAAVLRVKLPRLSEWTEARRANAARYRALFDSAGLVDRIALPEHVEGHVYNQFVVRAPERDGLREHLAAHGVETAVYYPIPLHLQECFRGLGYRPGDLPASERAAEETLALPIYPELTERQQREVVDRIADFYG